MPKSQKKQGRLFRNVSQSSSHSLPASMVSLYLNIAFIRACEKCTSGNRKTINGDDLLFSLNQLGFDRYIENLNIYYQKYKDVRLIHIALSLGLKAHR